MIVTSVQGVEAGINGHSTNPLACSLPELNPLTTTTTASTAASKKLHPAPLNVPKTANSMDSNGIMMGQDKVKRYSPKVSPHPSTFRTSLFPLPSRLWVPLLPADQPAVEELLAGLGSINPPGIKPLLSSILTPETFSPEPHTNFSQPPGPPPTTLHTSRSSHSRLTSGSAPF